jgi:hypothetical protein
MKNFTVTEGKGELANVLSIHFDNLHDLIASEVDQKSEASYNIIKRTTKGFEKLGANSMDEVVSMALYGSDWLLEKVNALSANAEHLQIGDRNEIMTRRRRKRIKGDHGDEIDIQAVLMGKLDRAWTRRKHIEIDSEFSLYTVLVDVGGLWDVTFDESIHRAIVALRVTDDLIQAGKSVRVIVGSAAAGVYKSTELSGKIITTDITVKEYNEPLSLERLVAMSHIGFHRSFNWKARAMLPNVNSNMGSTNDYLKHFPPAHMDGEASTRYIYIPQCLNMIDVKNALRSIQENLQRSVAVPTGLV